ncbi:hypothetical protein [Marinomonas piezotolerans]|uniref:hypothetical protein n=1 Tax=Marinomonas piezotolerans TaxID=2213058 RepID=UPI001FE34548|nr:hypothetical protein [Marinomonas piezotolerans]
MVRWQGTSWRWLPRQVAEGIVSHGNLKKQLFFTLAIIGAVVAEFVAAEEGLGYFIQFSTSFFKIPQAFAGLIFLAAISLLLFKSVQWVQAWWFPWSLPKKKH